MKRTYVLFILQCIITTLYGQSYEVTMDVGLKTRRHRMEPCGNRTRFEVVFTYTDNSTEIVWNGHISASYNPGHLVSFGPHKVIKEKRISKIQIKAWHWDDPSWGGCKERGNGNKSTIIYDSNYPCTKGSLFGFFGGFDGGTYFNYKIETKDIPLEYSGTNDLYTLPDKYRIKIKPTGEYSSSSFIWEYRVVEAEKKWAPKKRKFLYWCQSYNFRTDNCADCASDTIFNSCNPNGEGEWAYQLVNGGSWREFTSGRKEAEIVGNNLPGIGNFVEDIVKNKKKVQVRIKYDCGYSEVITLDPIKSSPTILGYEVIKNKCKGDNSAQIKLKFSEALLPGENIHIGFPAFKENTSNITSFDAENCYTTPPMFEEGSYQVALLGKYPDNLTATYTGANEHTHSVTIQDPDSVKFQINKFEDVNCYGGVDGKVYFSLQGGVPPYNIVYTSDTWSDTLKNIGSVSAVIDTLRKGTYTFKVYDANNCFALDANGEHKKLSAIINEPSSPVEINSLDILNLSGYRTNNGHIKISSKGGNGGYAYTWIKDGLVFNPVPNDSTALDIAAGKYLLMSSDSKYVRASTKNRSGCFDTVTIHLLQPDSLIADMEITNPISCFGDSDGILEAKISGGVPPYTNYKWEKQNGSSWMEVQNGTSTILEECSEGNYRLSIIDQARIPNTATSLVFPFKQPQKIQSDGFEYSLPSCNDFTDGNIKVNIRGGRLPYTYRWNASLEDVAELDSISAGFYSVAVSDSSGCSLIDTLTVSEPPALQLSSTFVMPSAYNTSDGSIHVQAIGGTGAYTYSWNYQSRTENPLADIPASDTPYIAVVRDAHLCTDSIATRIIYPLNVEIIIRDSILCAGDANGKLFAFATGGVGKNYSYQWYKVENSTEIPIGYNDSILDSVNTGTYKVIATDLEGNTIISSELVFEEPTPLTVSSTFVMPSAYNASDGEIHTNVNGGTPAYTYRWHYDESNNPNLIGIPASDTAYKVTVNDRRGCSVTLPTRIIYPLEVKLFIRDSILCAGDANGKLFAFATGGVGKNYSYQWYKIENATNLVIGTNDSILSEVERGTYKVEVTDKEANTVTSTVLEFQEPNPLLVNSTFIMPSAYNASDGAIYTSVSGGTDPYSYRWHYDESTNPNLIGIPPCDSAYKVTVTDRRGCFVEHPTRIIYPLEVKIIIRDSILCASDTNGKLLAFATGGVGKNYIYQWYKIENATNIAIGTNDSILSNVEKGTYKVEVTDQEANTITSTMLEFQEPNPLLVSSSFVMPSTYNSFDGEIHTSVSGGTDPYSYRWHYDDSTNPSLLGIPACDTAYQVTISDRRGCFVVHPTRIIYPLGVEISLVDTIFCAEKTNGSLSAFAFGGVGTNYTYSWSKFEDGSFQVLEATHSLLSGIGTGLYKLLVKDIEDNTISAEFTINSPDTLKVSLLPTHLKCKYDTNGLITPLVSGGNFPYSYWWSNEQTDEVATNLEEGTHHLTVTDFRGCIAKASELIHAPDELLTTSYFIPPRAYDYADASAWIKAEGGVLPYTYLWEGRAETTDSLFNLLHGLYVVTTTDANACFKVDSITIPNPPLLEAFIEETRVVSCNGRSDAQLTASSQGGVGDHRYTWYEIKNGIDLELSKRSVLNNIPAGTYKLKVSDDNNIDAFSEIYVLAQPEVLSASTSANNIACNGDTDGWVRVEAKGGTQPYSYSWSTGDTTQQVNNLTDDRYLVFVTDNRGCITKTVAEITVPGGLVVKDTVTQPACHNQKTGAISFSISGGVAPYTWLWEDGSKETSRTNLASGTYNLKVTGANGCFKELNYTIENPELLQIDVGSDKTLCKGQVISLDATIPDGTFYQWELNKVSVGNEAIIHADKAGVYEVTVINNKGCEGKASVQINIHDKDISSSFAVASKVEAGEILHLVNTNPGNEETIIWIYNTDDPVKVIDSLDHRLLLVYTEPGEYIVGMRALNGDCEQIVYKQIEVVEKYSLTEDLKTDNEAYLKKFSIYPNPSTGIFTVDVELKEIAEIELSLYSLAGKLLSKQVEQGNKQYQIRYNISDKADGLYIIKLVSPKIQTSVKLIKGR